MFLGDVGIDSFALLAVGGESVDHETVDGGVPEEDVHELGFGDVDEDLAGEDGDLALVAVAGLVHLLFDSAGEVHFIPVMLEHGADGTFASGFAFGDVPLAVFGGVGVPVRYGNARAFMQFCTAHFDALVCL